jgi:hypothetical protein
MIHYTDATDTFKTDMCKKTNIGFCVRVILEFLSFPKNIISFKENSQPIAFAKKLS